LDTGVFPHADLNLYRCISFLNSKYLRPVVLPPNACPHGDLHGTHVAGIAAAKDNNIGVVGTAPGARIWALQVLHPTACQCGDDSDVIAGLNYVAEHAKEIEVANLSLEGTGNDGRYARAINSLVLYFGVVVVVAAGNDNVNVNGVRPAGVSSAITVSAMSDSDGRCGGAGQDIQGGSLPRNIYQAFTYGGNSVPNHDDFFASYSNFGPGVDLAAPGSWILSTINQTRLYDYDSGTSMAAPHIAGAAALIKSLYPGMSPLKIDAFLKNIGTKAPATGNPRVCDAAGRGYFDDRYPTTVYNDKVKEPLLYMGLIQ
jgi:subtilisin